MPGLDGFKLCQALRGDDRFSDVHVILTSSAYVEDGDRELATASGADVLIERTPELDDLLAALTTALAQGEPAPEPSVSSAVEEHHAERVTNQADRQAAENSRLRSRLALQSVELSVLGSLSDMLTSPAGVVPALDEMLTSCADMTGISRAAVYLRGDDGSTRSPPTSASSSVRDSRTSSAPPMCSRPPSRTSTPSPCPRRGSTT